MQPFSQSTFLAALLSCVALAACGNEAETGPNGEAVAATATSVAQANLIYVNANRCAGGVRAALADEGFGVTNTAADADATLTVSVSSQGRNLDEIPEFGGFGSKASYNAQLIGADGAVLWSTVGEEGSITGEEMCGDIGDEIASRLEDRRG